METSRKGEAVSHTTPVSGVGYLTIVFSPVVFEPFPNEWILTRTERDTKSGILAVRGSIRRPKSSSAFCVSRLTSVGSVRSF